MEEVWKDVVGWEGLYQVSSLGLVRSLDREVQTKNSIRQYRGKMLKLMPNNYGYSLVGIGGKLALVHRLVLEAFVGSCPEGMEARHYPDRNPANNCVENLSWATHQINCQDRDEHGTSMKGYVHTQETRDKIKAWRATQVITEETKMKMSQSGKLKRATSETRQRMSLVQRGDNNPMSLLKEQDVFVIRTLHHQGMKTRALADKFGVHIATIRDVIKGRTWKHLLVSEREDV